MATVAAVVPGHYRHSPHYGTTGTNMGDAMEKALIQSYPDAF